METPQNLGESLGLQRIATEIFRTKMAIESLERTYRHRNNLEDFRRPDDFMKKAEESDSLIRENYKEWRDYLHKYVLVMMTVSGFFAAILSSTWIQAEPNRLIVRSAFGAIGTSIALGLIAIFVTIYIEKKIIDARVMFALPRKDRDKRISPVVGMKMDYEEWIAEVKAKLAVETDPQEREWLEVQLRANKKGARLPKYVAAPAEWFEYLRVGTTAIMMTLSFAGIVLLMSQTI